MNISQATEHIGSTKPQVVYISGKTSTGKSTLSRALKEQYDYTIIELDEVVLESVIKRYSVQDRGYAFIEVYRNNDRQEWIDSFISAAREIISNSIQQGHRVVLEGAVSSTATLQRLLEGLAVETYYLHPVTLENYTRNLSSRFVTANAHGGASLPKGFWQLIDDDEFATFNKTRSITPRIQESILEYARSSQAESLERLNNLKISFDNVHVVTV